MRFRTTLLLSGTTATGMEVPPEIVENLGRGKRPPVRVTINGHTYRSTIAVYGNVFMLGVSAENRVSAGVQAGEEIDVDLELDAAPREITVPQDLQLALDRDTTARSAFEALSYSRKQFFVLPIEGAKAPETRARRIEKTIEVLRSGGGPR